MNPNRSLLLMKDAGKRSRSGSPCRRGGDFAAQRADPVDLGLEFVACAKKDIAG
jgi:hypothetical protein